MLHPSYTDLMKVVNKDVEEGETKIVNSRYSIVMATSKRARQLIDGDQPLVNAKNNAKSLSVAIQELNEGKLKVLAEGQVPDTAEAADTKTDPENAGVSADGMEGSEETGEAPETGEQTADTEPDDTDSMETETAAADAGEE